MNNPSTGAVPPPRYIPAERVLGEMAAFGHKRLTKLNPLRVIVLAILAGGFITTGALLSVLLAEGVHTKGLERLIEGFGFSAGFFFVVLSETVLFTEANVVLPVALLEAREARWRVARFWILAWIGNFAGVLLIGGLISFSHDFSPEMMDLLRGIVDRKLGVAAAGGIVGWGSVVVSGMLANWLVGMAAMFAMMGRTIFGKYIPILLAVTLFVAANFQHSPANMGYFALLLLESSGPGWNEAIFQSIIPAGIGNLIGGTVLVALPFWYAFKGLDSAS